MTHNFKEDDIVLVKEPVPVPGFPGIIIPSATEGTVKAVSDTEVEVYFVTVLKQIHKQNPKMLQEFKDSGGSDESRKPARVWIKATNLVRQFKFED